MLAEEESGAKRLQRSLVVSSTLGIFSVAVIVAVASIAPLYEYLKKEQERTLVLALNAKTTAVEEYLARAKDVASQISSRTIARRVLDEYNRGETTLQELQEFSQEVLSDALRFSPEVSGLTRIDLKGTPVVRVGLEIPGEFLQRQDFRSRKILLHGPATLGAQSYLVVQSPILDPEGDLIGTDYLLFGLSHLQGIVRDYTGLGKTGEIILGVVNADRIDFVLALRGETVPQSLDKNSPLGAALTKGASKERGMLLTGKTGERHEVIVYGPVRGSDWGIALKMDLDELYAPLKRHVWATSNIIVILIMLSTVGMMLLVRPLAGKTIMHTDELEREIQEKTASLQIELNERKRVESWLRDSERRYHMLLENVPDVIFILDEVGWFTYVNTQGESFLDRSVQEILDTRLEEHIVPQDRPRVQAIFQLALGSVFDDEVRTLTPQGVTKFARIRCKASQEEDSVIRYEGVMRDITRRRLLEEELKSSREELLEKIRIIDELYEHVVQSGKSKAIADHTAEVAHELRQPLTIIGGFARRMHRQIESGKLKVTPELEGACGIIISEIQRLERILQGLIDFVRHEGLHLEKADPNDIIERVLKVYQESLAEKSISLEKSLGKEIGEIHLDPLRFEQVVRNLISNAVEASPVKGRITVETGVSIPSDKAQETGGLAAETYFEMKIRNDGTTIRPEELHKIFNPFYTTKDFGTGIGLSLSKKIVEEHNGSISVKSDEQGTQFTIWLPLSPHDLMDSGLYRVRYPGGE
jgi:PAS domain S-box-containing protein